MSTSISLFGAFHTAVSLAPVGIGLWAFAREGKIDLRKPAGRLYLVTMLIGTVTSFGIFSTGTLSPAHAVALGTLALLIVGFVAAYTSLLGRAARYIETFTMSASYFLLWIFTTTETLTRLPVGNPIASGPQSPALLAVHFSLLVFFAIGFSFQVLRQRGVPRGAVAIGARA